MKTFQRYCSIFLLLAVTLFAGCAGSKITKDGYTGRWLYTFPTMEGTQMDAVMTITQADDGFAGTLSSSMGSVDMQDLKIEEGKLTAFIEIEGYRLDISGDFSGDTFTGKSSVQGYEFPMNAVREK